MTPEELNKIALEIGAQKYLQLLNAKPQEPDRERILKIVDSNFMTNQSVGDTTDELIAYFKTLAQPQNIKCQCTPEQKHGNTAILCCNKCGLPEEDFWTKDVEL